ncbi:MAG: permease [Alphaproteobacteria bacterium]
MTETHSCCPAPEKRQFDYVLWGSTGVIVLTLCLSLSGLNIPFVGHFAHTVIEFLGTMWWGIALGIVFVGLMNKVPKEYFQVLLGRGDTGSGILRAALAGVLLDLCSHGILMVAAKLYERGASIAQVMAFLIASPWNSFSLTIILISLIGLKWTLIFIAASMAIAIVSGFVFMGLVRRGILPENPNKPVLPEHFSITKDAKDRLKNFKPSYAFFKDVLMGGMHEARMLLRWLLLGIVIASAIRTFIPSEIFTQWFGPTLLGLVITLIATTLIEVCSEGSTPIAAEIFNNAHAPGNAFAFLMAGVSTDYTEIMVLRETTKSWKIPLFLPLVTVPQTLIFGYLMNGFQ